MAGCPAQGRPANTDCTGRRESAGHLSTGEYTELSRLFVRMRNGGGFLPTTQVFRTEMYTYDANGNRATKTTAYGTITYSYDA